MVKHSGQCACGGVCFDVMDDPLFINVCHCHHCQRENGSPFACNALIEEDRLKLRSGAVSAVAVPTESGRRHDIFRCGGCGTPMWSIYERLPRIRFVRIGTLELASRTTLRPGAQIYTESRLPWVIGPEGVPAFDRFYDIKTVWPRESIERLTRVSR